MRHAFERRLMQREQFLELVASVRVCLRILIAIAVRA
jgi:hypothetical protein